MDERTCSVDACDKPYYCKGWCRPHYKAWKKWGDPLRRRPTEAERFWPKVNKGGAGGCWLWEGQLNNQGYATFFVNPKKILGHRWTYANLVGPVPAGTELDHLCRVPRCVNPDHLEPVTHGENLRRGYAARRAEAGR